MVARERQVKRWLGASRSLSGAGLLNERFAYLLMDCRSGRLLDANGLFFDVTGFTPCGVLQRVLDPVLASLNAVATPLSDIPLIKEECCDGVNEGGDCSVSRRQARWKPLRPLRQYPATVSLMEQLLTGHCDSGAAMFRCRWADGCGYEMQSNVWVVDAEWVVEADGRRWRRPLTFVAAAPVDGYCLVDEQ